MKLSGIMKKIMDTQTFPSGFRKREFVLEYAENPQYPQLLLFQLTQDKVEIPDKWKIVPGLEVEVSFNLRGREWVSPEGKTMYFNSLEAWRIDPAGASAQHPVQTQQTQPEPVQQATPQQVEQTGDDLPF